MKKVFRLFIFAFCLFLIIGNNVHALSYTEDEVIQKIQTTETKINQTVELLTNWSNSYASSLKSLFDRDFAKKVDSLNVNENIDIIISELSLDGYGDAANALSVIKEDLVNNYNYIKETLNIIENYLLENHVHGVTGNLDLFIQIRETAKNLKTPVVNLANIYYEIDYSDLRQKISQYDTVSEIIDLYDEAVNKLTAMDNIFSKFESKIKKWQTIYNLYYLSDYSNLFKEYFGEYYNKARTEYNKLYNELEEKLQSKLDSKIEVIVADTDMSDNESIMKRNTKLYDIMNYINEVKELAIKRFDKINTLIEIEKIIEKANKQQKRILSRLNEAISYTESYIIDYPQLMTKVKEDEKYINIDAENGIIIYNQRDLDEIKFVDRLIATLGDIKSANVYGGNIGTLSMIQLHYNTIVIGEYTIIVKGDIAPNAIFDITDVVKLCNKMFEKEELDEYLTIAADMNNDSKIDITDVVLLCNILFNK